MSDLPPGWVLTKLGDLGRWIGGGTPSKAVSEYWGGSIPWVSPKDMKVDRIRDTADHISEEALQASSTNLVAAGSVLLVTRSGILSHTLPVAVTDVDAALNQDLKALIPGGNVDSAYVAWALRSNARRVLDSCSKAGTTVANIDTKRLLDFEIPVAPIAEQRRIVAAIEEQFSRLDHAENAFRVIGARLRQLADSVHTYGLAGSWDEMPLRELSERITKGTTPSSLGRPFTAEGVLYVKAESLVNGVIEHTRCAHVDQETDDLLTRSRLAEDDVLITIAGTLGRVGVVRARDLPANTNQAVCLVRLHKREFTPWLSAWLRGPAARSLLASGGRGVGLQNLNLKQIGELSVPVPALEEQRRIVAEVEQQLSLIDSLRAAIESAQKRSAALRRAILERAFRGELVPQDPADEPASVLLDRIRAERAAAPPRLWTRNQPEESYP